MKSPFDRIVRDSELGLECTIEGFCPVQVLHGLAAGRQIYFHARHGGWSYRIAQAPQEECHDAPDGYGYCYAGYYDNASWMDYDDAEEIIRVCTRHAVGVLNSPPHPAAALTHWLGVLALGAEEAERYWPAGWCAATLISQELHRWQRLTDLDSDAMRDCLDALVALWQSILDEETARDFDSPRWTAARAAAQAVLADEHAGPEPPPPFWGPPLRTAARPSFGAFASLPLDLPGTADGPLSGLRFAVKDNFDLEGVSTAAGNPHWKATRGQSVRRTAAVISQLRAAGARLVAKTQMDEMAFGLFGRNIHYGTPTNPAAPDRVPGGSSGGSAVAVAGGLVDFAIGSDTAGSTRVPASFCGVWGMRPTHGRISTRGMIALAPSFDTVGWFARDAALLARVGRVLLRDEREDSITSMVVCEDLFALADENVRDALHFAVDQLTRHLQVRRAAFKGDVTRWAEGLRVLQGQEIWQVHGKWVKSLRKWRAGKTGTRPRAARVFVEDGGGAGVFAPDVADRLAWCDGLTSADVAPFEGLRDEVRTRLWELTVGGTVVCLPTVPMIAPPRDFDPKDIPSMRTRIAQLTCIATLGGAPQITLPIGAAGGCPCGISLIAAPSHDVALLTLASRLQDLPSVDVALPPPPAQHVS